MRLSVRLNGAERSFEVEDRTLLLDLLRDAGLTGAKPSCEMEVCGACTVLVDGLPVSACTTLAADADGRHVETIEGLAQGERLHPLQEAFVECFGFQCGFCTPGMILAAKSLLEHEPHPSPEQIVHWMDGNLCRCTGYQSILEAIELAAERTAR
jgi:aerobic-type carbon monoxide dehydrogenase small subunit (CoxS/CutS family)